MSPKPVRPLDPLCLPYRGKPEKTPLWADFQPWQGLVMPGWFYSEDLEVLREFLYKEGYIPRVQRNHKAELKKLTLTLEKGETLVLKKKPDHAEDLGKFVSQFGLEYRGQSLATCTELVLQQLLKQETPAKPRKSRRLL